MPQQNYGKVCAYLSAERLEIRNFYQVHSLNPFFETIFSPVKMKILTAKPNPPAMRIKRVSQNYAKSKSPKILTLMNTMPFYYLHICDCLNKFFKY